MNLITKRKTMLVSPWSNVSLTIWTYQINRNNVDKLNSVNLTSLNSEKSKTDFIVSKRLSYHVWKEKEEGGYILRSRARNIFKCISYVRLKDTYCMSICDSNNSGH